MPAGSNKFVGPEALAAELAPFLDQSRCHLDEHSLRNLLWLMYHASLVSEEGRFPTFRVICTNQTFGHSVEFDPPLSIETVDDLRRLAPALSDPDTAILVSGDSVSGLKAHDILDFREQCNVWAPEPELGTGGSFDFGLPDGALTIRVDGPGELRATIQPQAVLHLRGGEIRKLCSLY